MTQTHTHSSFYYLSSLEPPPFQEIHPRPVYFLFVVIRFYAWGDSMQSIMWHDLILLLLCIWRWLRECLWASLFSIVSCLLSTTMTHNSAENTKLSCLPSLSVSMPHWNNNANLWSTVFTAWICTCTKRQPHSPWWQSQWYYGFFSVYFHYFPIALFTTIIHKTKD